MGKVAKKEKKSDRGGRGKNMFGVEQGKKKNRVRVNRGGTDALKTTNAFRRWDKKHEKNARLTESILQPWKGNGCTMLG